MRRSHLSPVLLSTTVLFVPVSAHSQSEPSVPSDAIVLDTVVVEGGITETAAGPVRGVRALTANSSTRTDTPIEEIPQNIQVITKELVEQQAAVTVTEALRNTSNVQPLDSRVIGNVEQAPYKIRGFPAELWIDGFPGSLFPAGDRDGLANVERIEVLKGPNALLYGGGAGAPLGGVINIVSKLPEPVARYEAGGTIGSYGYWSPFFDLNQPLNKDGTALFRITGEYTHDDSFIDVLQSDRYNINPTLTLTDNDRTSLTLQGFFSRHEQEAYQGLPYFGTIAGDFRVRDELYLGHPDIEPSVTKQHGVTATLEHAFDEVWSTNVKARFSRSGIDQFAQTPFLDTTGTGGTPFLPPSLFDLNNLHHYSDQEELAVSPTVQAKFDYGPSRNTFLFGGDYSRVADAGGMIGDTLGNFCFLSGGGCTPTTVDLADPVFTTPFTRPEVGVGEGASFFDYDNTYITSGLYTQLQSTLYDRVHLVVGGRLASLDITYNENALDPPQSFVTKETKLLPRAGAVVDLVEGFSVFAGYSEGMRWVPFSQTFARPAPETSRSVEGGIKFNVSDALTGTLAVFQIDRENVPYQISFGVGGLSEQRSRGFEADVAYQATENWSVLASYGFTDAEFSTTVGVTPAGRAVPMVPDHSGRLWVNYDFTSEALEGWSVGGGLYAASNQFLNATQDWKTDGYVTFDARVGYENDRLRASLTAKNLTGEDYYTPYNWFGGQVAPGAPRSFYGQIAVKY